MRKTITLNYNLEKTMAQQDEMVVGVKAVEIKHCKAIFDVVLDRDILNGVHYDLDFLPEGVYLVVVGDTKFWVTKQYENIVTFDNNVFGYVTYNSHSNYVIDSPDVMVIVGDKDTDENVTLVPHRNQHITIATLPIFNSSAKVSEFRRSESKGGDIVFRPIC